VRYWVNDVARRQTDYHPICCVYRQQST